MFRYLCGFAIVVFCLALIVGCDEKPPVAPEEPGWASLGFEDHWVVELELDWLYLYACAIDEGLFRMRLSRPGSGWQYMGLADTSLADTTFGHYTNRGVLDVIPLGGGGLLAGIFPGVPHVSRVYRSHDDGKTWTPSDTCIGDCQNYPYVEPGVHSLERSPWDGDVILAGSSGAIYRSTDNGSSWGCVGGIVETGLGINDIRFHRTHCSLVWAAGETSFFEALLMKSTDHGETWEWLDTRKLAQYGEGACAVALHPTDPSILYVGLKGSVIKSTDGGATWASTAFPRAYKNFYEGLTIDPSNPEHLFAAAKLELFESWDRGRTVERLEIPDDIEIDNYITDLEYHRPSKTLYIGSLAGVFRYRDPLPEN